MPNKPFKRHGTKEMSKKKFVDSSIVKNPFKIREPTKHGRLFITFCRNNNYIQ